jgi:hypothetical protein
MSADGLRIKLIGGALVPLAVAGGAQAAFAIERRSGQALSGLGISLIGTVVAIAVVAALAARAARIERRNHELTNLLDNLEQGFLTVHADGTLAAERSAMATRLLGLYQPGQRLWEAIAPYDPTAAAWLDLCWASLLEDVMPRELALDQLPTTGSSTGPRSPTRPPATWWS